jgi:hypothetical protein
VRNEHQLYKVTKRSISINFSFKYSLNAFLDLFPTVAFLLQALGWARCCLLSFLLLVSWKLLKMACALLRFLRSFKAKNTNNKRLESSYVTPLLNNTHRIEPSLLLGGSLYPYTTEHRLSTPPAFTRTTNKGHLLTQHLRLLYKSLLDIVPLSSS